MDLHCPLTCGRCRTRRDMRISGQKIKMSDWGKLWSKKGKPQKLQCCRVQSKGVRNLESRNFFSWNRESCALEFRIQIKNPDPTIDWNPEHDPSSTDKESGIHYLYLRSGIMGVESRIQDCLGFPYMGRTVTDYGRGRRSKCANNYIMLLAGTSYTGQRVWTGRYCVRVPNQIINHHITFEKIGKRYF